MTAHRALRAGLPRSGPAYVVPSTSLLTGALLVMATLAVGCGPGGGEAPPEPVAFKPDRTELRRVTLPENAGLTAAQVDALKNAPGKITFTAPYDGEPTSKTTNPEGLIIEVFAEGEGDEAKEGSEVAVHYTGWMENGFEFDSSFKRGKTIDLELGTGRVIKGWEQGLLGIKKGGKRRLTIPAALGYQDRGKGPIPPDTTLVFIVEAVDVRAPLPAPRGDEAFAGEPVAKKTKQGVEISTLAEGAGDGAKAGNLVSLHYTGKLDDGTVFDSSVPRKAPFKFMLGKGQVIEGWDIGIEGMKVGELRKLVIPADKAYGDRASGKIPANSTLTFHVEMMRIASGDK